METVNKGAHSTEINMAQDSERFSDYLSAAIISFLNRWAFHIPIRAKNATVSFFWFK